MTGWCAVVLSPLVAGACLTLMSLLVRERSGRTGTITRLETFLFASLFGPCLIVTLAIAMTWLAGPAGLGLAWIAIGSLEDRGLLSADVLLAAFLVTALLSGILGVALRAPVSLEKEP